MGCILGRNVQPELENEKTPNRSADERTACIIRIKMERDKLSRKMNDLEEQIKFAHNKAKDCAQNKNKEQAIYYLAKKKGMMQNLNNFQKRILLIENRAREMENVMDDLKFTQLLNQSNNELKNLLEEVDYTALEEAKYLSDEVDMNNKQVQEIINNNNQDEDILNEFNNLGENENDLEKEEDNVIDNNKTDNVNKDEDRELLLS